MHARRAAAGVLFCAVSSVAAAQDATQSGRDAAVRAYVAAWNGAARDLDTALGDEFVDRTMLLQGAGPNTGVGNRLYLQMPAGNFRDASAGSGK